MNLTTLIVISGISIILYISGLWMNKKALFLSMAGALIIFGLGAVMFTNPLQEQIGTNITDIDPTTTNALYIYQNISPMLNNTISTTFIILGFFGMILPITMYRKSQFSQADKEGV